jgi:hypothetical protein
MAMTATDTTQRTTGLWAAPAGSVLAGPLGSGQPISVFVPAPSMFDYPADEAVPVDEADLALIERGQLACA